ncbi:MAG: carboxypeptidase M32 [Flavobacteriales bacterium]
MKQEYEALQKEMQRIADVQNAAALLMWDQETYMPAKGAAFRAQQLAALSGIAHDQFTAEEMGTRIERLDEENSLSSDQALNVKRIREDQEKASRYGTDFVQELSKAQSEAFQAWQQAKEKDDFERFAPELERIVDLKQKEANLLGYEDHPYDALLDNFEPGLKTQKLEKVMEELREGLDPLLHAIHSCEVPDDSVMYGNYPTDRQWDQSMEILRTMGYDMEKGRQDLSTHPFTISFSPEDVRVTTRMKENDLHEAIWSSIHEGGHALYEQGLPIDTYGLPQSEACSLSVHESQARLWENIIGRGRPFWEYFHPRLQERFPEQLGATSLDAFYQAMNVVRPGLIRTNADELSYHFHIIIRFEIEKGLIEGSIEVKDVPDQWNEKVRRYLGIEVPSDAQGCLQDIHWAHGGIGYFPTYSLGSLMSAQFYDQACKELPELEKHIAKGELLPMREWLRERIHSHGRLERPEELCERVTGDSLDPQAFLNYAREKYGKLYSLEEGARKTGKGKEEASPE